MQNNAHKQSTNGAKNDPLRRGCGGDKLEGLSPLPGAPSSNRFAGDKLPDFFATPQPEEGAKKKEGKSNDGRPKVLDERKKGAICGMIAMGVSRRRAARYVGCHHKTIANEATRDPQFDAALREAEMNAEMEPLSNLYAATSHSWRACAWLLKTLRPSDYSGKPTHYQMVQHDDDTLDQYVQGYQP